MRRNRLRQCSSSTRSAKRRLYSNKDWRNRATGFRGCSYSWLTTRESRDSSSFSWGSSRQERRRNKTPSDSSVSWSSRPSFFSSSSSRWTSSPNTPQLTDPCSCSSSSCGRRTHSCRSRWHLILSDNNLKPSVIDAVSVVALLAFVEDGWALVHASGLHDVVFHFRVVALGAPFLYYHFALASALAEASACLVLVKPILVLAHGEFGLDDFACVVGGVPANYLKLSSLPQIWQWMLASMV